MLSPMQAMCCPKQYHTLRFIYCKSRIELTHTGWFRKLHREISGNFQQQQNKRWQASGFNQPDRPSYHIRAPHGVIKQLFVEANQRRIISWTHASLDTQCVNVQNSIRPQHAYNMHVPSKWHVRNDLTKTSYSFEIGGLIFLICELCLIFPCGSTCLPLVIFGSQAAYFGVGGWKLSVQEAWSEIA